VVWCNQSDFMALFMVGTLWIGPGFKFESCSQVLIFSSHFPVTTPVVLRYISEHVYCFCGVQ